MADREYSDDEFARAFPDGSHLGSALVWTARRFRRERDEAVRLLRMVPHWTRTPPTVVEWNEIDAAIGTAPEPKAEPADGEPETAVACRVCGEPNDSYHARHEDHAFEPADPEPQCKLCGHLEADHGPDCNVWHAFQPEEPGHG